ncbi:MAG: alpha-amylase family glycosyl hydrolase [Paludibacter sp.]|nr:alpha-amylase family glycosyl hydrolase [Paludibacter sp.]
MRNIYQKLIIASISLILSQQMFAGFVGGRTDFRDETIYFVITTRFYDGDSGNNVKCWDGNNPGDPAWRGDFKGLIEKLDYIKALGFTAVWITPVVENASGYDYHGYHAMNFNKVDERYNSEDVNFQDVINAVHARGMKIILDIVLNHTGNFGEETLCPMFKKQGDLGNINCMQRHPNSQLPANYASMSGGEQYQTRLALMKNTDGQNHDSHNYWHHYGNFSWETIGEWWAQIAGDCVDLNTENPAVYNYLIQCYTQFINMGVDGFRIDTGKHISRVTFNKVFTPRLMAAAAAAGKPNFYLCAEICARVRGPWNHDIAALSAPFYTWKESVNYSWSEDATQYNNVAVYANNWDAVVPNFTNINSCIQLWNANNNTGGQPSSSNHYLNGNNYRTVSYSQKSDLNVIDFPMHRNFSNAYDAFNCKNFDNTYADATWNMVYVDSHDYSPEPDERVRFNGDQSTWAENMSLMFTFRGIPCLYYGSEIEFKKGKIIDDGPNTPLINTGRAYFGGYIKGNVNVTDFATYSNATGNMAVTLKSPLALHLQRLNKIRQAVPALRKGQYSTDNVSGGMAFKRRYTDATTDSYALVTISGNATFSSIPNGTYKDAVTGDVQNVTNGTLTANCSGKGNLRVYVLTTSLTAAPGKVGDDGKYIYGSSSVNVNAGSYDGTQEELTTDTGGPITVVEPKLCYGEQAVFFHKPDTWGDNVNLYVYDSSSGTTNMILGAWPGQAMTNLGNNYFKFIFNQNIATTWQILFNTSNQQTPSGGQPGWHVTNGAIYQVASSESAAIERTLSETDCTSATENLNNYENLRIFVAAGNLCIESREAQTVTIFSVDGRLVRTANLQVGLNIISNLQRGVYIVSGKKVII